MKKISPAESVKIICNGLLHFDKKSLKKIGFNPVEYEKDVTGNMANILVQSGGINFSESQITKIRRAILNIFKRSNFEVETVSENENNATVKVSLSVFKKFSQVDALKNLPSNVAELSESEKIDAVANILVNALNEMKIHACFEFFADCVYEENLKMWLPADGQKFGLTITTKIFDFE